MIPNFELDVGKKDFSWNPKVFTEHKKQFVLLLSNAESRIYTPKNEKDIRRSSSIPISIVVTAYIKSVATVRRETHRKGIYQLGPK